MKILRLAVAAAALLFALQAGAQAQTTLRIAHGQIAEQWG